MKISFRLVVAFILCVVALFFILANDVMLNGPYRIAGDVFGSVRTNPPSVPFHVPSERCFPNTSMVTTINNGLVSDDAKGWRVRYGVARRQRSEQQTLRGNGMTGAVYFATNFEPTFGCSYKERVGNPGDGGHWVCNPTSWSETQPLTLISVYETLVPRTDFSFEDELSDFVGTHNIQIHLVSSQSKPLVEQAPFPYIFHFYNSPKTIQEILKTASASKRRILLKMDVDGAERDLIRVFTFPPPEIEQIFLDVHLHQRIYKGTTADTTNELLWELTTVLGYEIFSKEPNTLERGGVTCKYGFVRVPWKEICNF
jgi:hypothetical protein